MSNEGSDHVGQCEADEVIEERKIARFIVDLAASLENREDASVMPFPIVVVVKYAPRCRSDDLENVGL